MNQNSKKILLILPIVAVIVFFDQWTKTLVERTIPIGGSISPVKFLGDFLQILHWKNTGAAFGIFQNANLILMFLTSIIILVLNWYYFSMKESNLPIQIGLSLAIGGAIGNLIDRITQGYVTDFLSLGRFPIFNVGDSAVTVGVGIMVLALLFEAKHKKPSSEDATELKDEDA